MPELRVVYRRPAPGGGAHIKVRYFRAADEVAAREEAKKWLERNRITEAELEWYHK